MKYCIAGLFIIAAIFVGCKSTPSTLSKASNKPDFLAANLDTTIQPGDDFFEYANGGWLKKNPVPAAESRWGIGNLVLEENLKRLRTINEDAAKENAKTGSASQKIGDYWKAAMDSSAIEKKGLADIQPHLDTISHLTSNAQLPQLLSYLHSIGVGTVVGMFVTQDDKNSDSMSLKFWQYGLYLPEREYYFKTDSTSLAIVAAYKQLVTKFLTMSGMPNATAADGASAIFKMEKALAVSHRKRADLRDPIKNYNKMPVGALYKLAPSLHMDNYFKQLHLPTIDSVIVGQPEYYAALEKIVKATPVDVWKMYLRFRVLDEFSEALPNAFGEEKF